MIVDPLAIGTILAAAVVLSLFLEERCRFCRLLGAALLTMLLSTSLSNLGILPEDSSAYAWLTSWGVNLSIVLILVGVDLRSVVRAGPAMLGAFALASTASMAGTLVAMFLFQSEIGREAWKLAGLYTGTYIGGGMNFVALARALDTPSDLFSAAVAADVIVSNIWLIACLTVPLLWGTSGAESKPRRRDRRDGVFTLEDSLRRTQDAIHLGQVASLGLLALGLVWLSGLLRESLPSIPQVLWLTSLALIAAQISAIRSLSGGPMIGYYLLLLSIAATGSRALIRNVLAIGPAVFLFALSTVFVHGLLLFGIGKLLRLRPALLAVASQATIGGVTSALTLATARRYTDELLPGVAAGLLGYAVGNYAGFLVARLARAVWG